MGDDDVRARTAIGELIHTHRSRRGWSREDLAGRIQLLATVPGRKPARGDRERMHPNTIANWETLLRPGERPTIPQLNTLRRVAEVFGFAPDSPEYRELFAARHEAEVARRAEKGLRRSTPPPPRPAAEGTPFLEAGRESHIQRLQQLAQEAMAGNARVALIHAEPGAGKSALVREVMRRAASEPAGAAGPLTILSGCRDGGQADGLAPARDVLAAALAFRDARRGRSEGPAAFLAAALDAELPLAAWPLPPGMLETLATHPALAQPLRARLGAALAQARGQVIADEGQQAAAWADAIVMLARTAPEGLVLAIEDLHWAAPAFVGALAALVDRMCGERAGDLPLLLVLTWRPADLHEPRLGSPHPALAFLAGMAARFPGGDIDLQTAIGGEAGIAFVRAMLAQQGGGSPPPSFVAALAARTDGLPLFVTGMLRLLRERGLAGEGIGAPDRDLDWSAIPAELDALFRDRLGRLDPTARDLLAWASVQGEQFAGEPLCMALGIERAVGFDLLDRDLARRDLVTAVGERSTNERRPDAPVEHVWAFAHALLRDFMLREMSPFERRRAHLRTADALVAIHGAEAHPCSDRIAWHLEQGGDLHRAATAWVRAGDQAVTDGDVLRADRHFAHVEAMGAAMANPPMLVQSYLGRATCARAMGDAVDALRFAEMGVARAREVGHAPVLANALQVASTVHFDRGRHLEGIAALREAQPIIEGLGDPVEGCRIECLLAFNLIAVGHYDEAMARATRAVGLADHVGTDRVGITARVALANVRVELGEYEAALLKYAEGVARAQRDGHAVSEALCWVNIGLCHVELGDATAATEALARVHDLGRELPVLGFVAAAHFDAAILAESLGRLDEAERAFRWSLDLREEIGQQALQVDSLAGLLRVAVAQGDAGVAGPLLEQVEARLHAGGLIGSEHHGRLFLAVIRGNRLLGRADREAEVAGEAMAFLRGRLAHIGDAGQRRSYLDGVPTHRALLAEIGAVLGGIPPDLRVEPGAVGCEVPRGATGHPAGEDG